MIALLAGFETALLLVFPVFSLLASVRAQKRDFRRMLGSVDGKVTNNLPYSPRCVSASPTLAAPITLMEAGALRLRCFDVIAFLNPSLAASARRLSR